MDSKEIAIRINELKNEISKLPVGYISKKSINGKTRYYHQWTELGKIKSKYIKDGEFDGLREQIEKKTKPSKGIKTIGKGGAEDEECTRIGLLYKGCGGRRTPENDGVGQMLR